jgi:hypothetical protein
LLRRSRLVPSLPTWRGAMTSPRSIRGTGSEQRGRVALLPADRVPAFVPVISVESRQANEPAQELRAIAIEIVVGAVMVRVPAGAEARDVEAVLRAVRRSNA